MKGMLLAIVILTATCTDAAETGSRGAPEESTAVTKSGGAPERSPSAISPYEPLEAGRLKAPPPVTVRYLDQTAELHAWTYCYRNGCVDGAPPKKPHDIGNPEEVIVEYPLPKWSFMASFKPAGDECGRVQRVRLEESGDGFVLRPAGYAGEYDVTLDGEGGGSLVTTFRWTTPYDGPLPEPRARLAVIAGSVAQPLSYGVELEVRNLESTPRKASAKVTVTAGNGNALTFEATPSRGDCSSEGTVYWDGPDEEGVAAARLGAAPFTYDVELVLDGERYHAGATWPKDEIRGFGPSVRLDFTPSLPALS